MRNDKHIHQIVFTKLQVHCAATYLTASCSPLLGHPSAHVSCPTHA